MKAGVLGVGGGWWQLSIKEVLPHSLVLFTQIGHKSSAGRSEARLGPWAEWESFRKATMKGSSELGVTK